LDRRRFPSSCGIMDEPAMRTVVLFTLYALVTLVFLFPLLVVCFVFRMSQPLIWAGKLAMRIGPAVLGLRVQAEGMERVKRGEPYIFMANHASFLDGPLLFLLIPQPVRVIMKKEAFRIPLVGLGMRQVGFVPVDRKGIRGGKKSIDRAARLMREKGYSFLIFPEGTRSLDGRLQPFRRGGFFLALESGVPVFPISIQGTFQAMPKGRFFVKKGTIRVVFHSPLPVRGYTRESLPELMEEVRKAIRSGIGEGASD